MHLFEAFVYFFKCVVFLDLQDGLVTSSWVLKTMYLGVALLLQDSIPYSQVTESCTRKHAVSGLPEVVIHSRNVSFERHIIEKQR